MLNAKYFVAGASAQAVIPNPDANGNAWTIRNVRIVSNPDEEIGTLGELNTKSEAVVDKSKFPDIRSNYEGTGSIELMEYKPNRLSYSANLSGDAFVVFSEVYYPNGWQATIDSKPVEIVRTNYVLRALEVPSGSHEIIFEFKPAVYSYGNIATTISSILVLLLVFGSLIVEFKVIRLKF